MFFQSALHGFYGHFHPGTKSAGFGNDDFFNRHRNASSLEESLDSVNPESIPIRSRHFGSLVPKNG
jgi:hypothetical protein